MRIVSLSALFLFTTALVLLRSLAAPVAESCASAQEASKSQKDAKDAKRKKKSQLVADRIVLLQSNDPHVQHVVTGEQYVIRVRFQESLLGRPSDNVSFESLEEGKWSQPAIECGRYIEPDLAIAKPIKDEFHRYEARLPKVGEVYQFQLAIDVDPERAEREFQEKLASLRNKAIQDGKLPKGEQQRETEINSRIRDLCVSAIDELKPKGADKDSIFMGQATFYKQTDQPVQALKDLYRWWEFEKMFNQLDERLDPDWEDSKRLDYGQEMMDLLCGRLSAEKAGLIKAERIEKLRQYCRIEYSFEFIPQPEEGQFDDGWKEAPRVGFGKNGPRSALWSSAVGAASESSYSKWLSFTPDSNTASIELDVSGDPPSVSVMWVQGVRQESYLRVIPKDPHEVTQCRITMTQKSNKGTQIEIPDRPKRKVSFPY